jgi:hypothetical protein
MPRVPKERAQALKEQIINLYTAGEVRPTLQDIAEQLGTTRQYVSLVLKDSAIKVEADPGISPKRIRWLRDKSGLSVSEFATLLGTSESRIHYWSAGESHPKGEHAMRLYLLGRALEHASGEERKVKGN